MTKPTFLKSRAALSVLAFMLTMGSAGPTLAQGFINPFIGYNFGGDAGCPEISGCEDKNLNLGVSLGTLGRVMGFELDIAHASDFFGETPGVSSSVLTLMGNLMVAPKIGFVQPYALIGLGLVKTNAELDLDGLLESDNNHLGWDVGGGLIVFLGRHVGLRGDIRYVHAFQDLELLGISLGDTQLDFGRASAGVVFKF